MAQVKKQPEREFRVNVDLGRMRDRMKARCALLGITMQDGILEAVNFWLKEGRRKAA
jgi:hypothetical protein